MTDRKRSLFAGMTDYTGVSIHVILAHLRDWHSQTLQSIEALKRLKGEVETHREKLDWPDDILGHIDFFLDLFARYAADFERLLTELPRFVTAAHVEIVQQIYDSASHEDDHCVRFKRDHISHHLKDEELRWLVDEIYRESRSMMIDYRDLSNLVPRLRTFIGTTSSTERELEQKFRILYGPGQEQLDFAVWAAEGAGTAGYSIGVIFLDVDDFKRLNSAFTESVVDRAVLPPLQRLVRDLSRHRGAAYRHGGEELLVILPNCSLDEAVAFGEKLRRSIEAETFAIDEKSTARLTISAGVATWPLHGETLERVIEAANRAEHAAKDAGKNRVSSAPA